MQMTGADHVVRAYPRDDPDFERAVHDAIASCRETIAESAQFVPRVRSVLRGRYPNVKLSLQSPLAVAGAGPLIYAYRDGRLVPATGSLPAIAMQAVEG